MFQAGVYDGRERFGGTVTLHMPQRPDLACYGCLLPPSRYPSAAVFAPAAQLMGHLAAYWAVTRIADCVRDAGDVNVIAADLQRFSVQPLTLARRRRCAICG